MAEGALIALGFFLLGRFLPARRKRPRPQKPPQPVCGCTHHHSFHDPETGECHAAVRGEPTHQDHWGNADGWERLPCACCQYSGPVPLPEVYAPEIGG